MAVPRVPVLGVVNRYPRVRAISIRTPAIAVSNPVGVPKDVRQGVSGDAFHEQASRVQTVSRSPVVIYPAVRLGVLLVDTKVEKFDADHPEGAEGALGELCRSAGTEIGLEAVGAEWPLALTLENGQTATVLGPDAVERVGSDRLVPSADRSFAFLDAVAVPQEVHGQQLGDLVGVKANPHAYNQSHFEWFLADCSTVKDGSQAVQLTIRELLYQVKYIISIVNRLGIANLDTKKTAVKLLFCMVAREDKSLHPLLEEIRR